MASETHQDTKTGRQETGPDRYVIVVNGALDARWSVWFDGMTLSTSVTPEGKARTLLEGDVRDQGALHGLLARVRDLNLTLLGVYRMDGAGGMNDTNDINDGDGQHS